MSPRDRRVMAIVVTYMPDTTALQGLLRTLLTQVEQVLVVDNTPGPDDRVYESITGLDAWCSTLRLVRLGENLGIAAALNIGIETAIAEGFDYVLFSDQDSLPSDDMVAQLLQVAEDLQAKGTRVGYVGATYIDHVTGQPFGFQVQEPGKLFYSTLGSECADPYIEVITGITSGSLTPCSAFADIGLMREDYFIDYVDTEWFHRARHRGYRLYGTSRATMAHHLGDDTFRVWYLRWRPFSGYSPQRLYYRFRNFVLLMRCNYVPWRWKVRAGWYWLGNAYAYLLFSPRRKENCRFVVRGLLDGLRGRTGPAPDTSRRQNEATT